MNKKVLVDLFYLNTALTGIKTYMLEFCAGIQEFPPDECEIIFTHNPSKQASDDYFRGTIPFWRKLFYHIYYFIYKQILLPIKVWKYEADVLICFDFVAPAIPLKIHKLVVIHDAFFWQMPKNYNAFWRMYFLKTIYWGIKGNTTVITTSHYSKKSLLAIANIQKPIEVIYQCPKLLPENESVEILDQLSIAPHRYLLHIGSFDKRKLLPVLVAAFSVFEEKYPGELRLVLVGERGLSPALDDFENVKNKIQSLQMEDAVVITGFLSDTAVKSLYKNAFAYVFPSSNEGFGIPVIEAMANDLPVIISVQQALMEIADGAALISQTGNPLDLAKKIEELYQDQEFRQQFIAKGKIRRKDFSRKAFIHSFIQLIKKRDE